MTTIPPWVLLALSLPVLVVGQLLVRRVKLLSRFDLPAAVVGGLAVALCVLLWNLAVTPAVAKAPTTQIVATQPTTQSAAAPQPAVVWRTATDARWWTWIVMAEPEWKRAADGRAPSVDVYVPFSTAFFTCVGLCASWRVVRSGSWKLLLFIALAGVLAILQNVLGVAMARGLGEHPVLGMLCGGVTLTGGMNTAFANDDLFKEAGFADGKVVGAAATMFGIVTASLVAGALGGALIRHRHLSQIHAAGATDVAALAAAAPRRGFFDHLAFLARHPAATLMHLLLLFVCIKAGAWFGLWLRGTDFITDAKLKFPIYMPGLLLAIVVRNILDAINPKLVQSEIVDRLAGVSLGIFLVAAISSLNLLALKSIAGPMLVILSAQVMLMAAFALGVTFVAMGRDYDAAIISTGHMGFGLGMTTNAVATMDVLTAKYGPSPRAFLIVTIVGAFLVDVVNSLVITASLRFVH